MINTISDAEFSAVQKFIFDAAGIHMSAAKKALVCGRLAKRLAHHGLDSYGQYMDLVKAPGAGGEAQLAVDLLTTNETYFFREGKHFERLRELALGARPGTPFRVWSAACSSGEEPYSIAMVLSDALRTAPWEVLGTDISTRVLERAQTGIYAMERTQHIPPEYLKRFCLKGTGTSEGTLLVERVLRDRVKFAQVNLNESLPRLGPFDVAFLRNVMIYFTADTKREVVRRVAGQLKPGGLLFIGHSESLHDIDAGVRMLAPSVYTTA